MCDGWHAKTSVVAVQQRRGVGTKRSTAFAHGYGQNKASAAEQASGCKTLAISASSRAGAPSRAHRCEEHLDRSIGVQKYQRQRPCSARKPFLSPSITQHRLLCGTHSRRDASRRTHQSSNNARRLDGLRPVPGRRGEPVRRTRAAPRGAALYRRRFRRDLGSVGRRGEGVALPDAELL